jgi:hypothetical protein
VKIIKERDLFRGEICDSSIVGGWELPIAPAKEASVTRLFRHYHLALNTFGNKTNLLLKFFRF